MSVAEAKQSSAQDSNLVLHRRTREFIKLYERHAYSVFNLALRISGERAAAARASERAFMGQLSQPESRLTQAVVTAALAEAGKSGAGKGEQGTMAALATLAPPQRAALALKALAGAGPAEVAEAMSLTPEAAGRLLNEALAGLAAKLGVDAAGAEQACEDWPWVEPPPDIWSGVYPRIHAGLKRGEADSGKRHLQAVGAASAAGGAAEAAGAPRGARRRRPRRALVALVGLIALGALAYAQFGSDDSAQTAAPALGTYPGMPDAGASGDKDADGNDSGGDPAASKGPLTPEELDRLRLQELQQLKAYEKKQVNKRLSAAQRQAAAIDANRLILIARRRQALAERRALRERLRAQRLRAQRDQARQRARDGKGDSGSGEQRVVIDEGRTPKQPSSPKQPAKTPAPGPPKTREEADAKCLFNPDTGTYICPE